LIVKVLDEAAYGRLTPRPQPSEGVTYAPKLSRAEGRFDWRQPAPQLERQVRAFDPWPGAFFEIGGEPIRVLAATALPQAAAGVEPGTVLDDQLLVACGAGALRPLRLQRAGRGPLERSEFLRGFPIPPGTLLPCPATS
jgi:methionyl-tRNA formyltransferase